MELTDRRRPDSEQLRLRKVLDVIDQGVCVIDRSTMRMLDVNDTACRLLGYDRAALLAADVAELGLDSSVDLAKKFDAMITADPEQSTLLAPAQTAQTIQLMRQDGSAMRSTITWHAMHEADQDHWVMIAVMSAAS
ncbi:MAG: PAS domain-containing protein [Undibacterium sp.]|nr:PAS domain-containing protein [Undibacterium sp.]